MYTRIAKVCHGTKRVPSPLLVEKGRMHVARMTGNPAFPDPRPSLAEVADACDALERASEVHSANGGRLDLLARNTAHQHLRELIVRLAGYVQATCNGDVLTVRSAGFEAKRKGGHSLPVAAPGMVRAKRSDRPGAIDLRWGGVKGKLLYAVHITEGDPSVQADWTLLLQTSKNHCTVSGLTTDKRYTFRVVASGALGEGPASDIATAKAA